MGTLAQSAALRLRQHRPKGQHHSDDLCHAEAMREHEGY